MNGKINFLSQNTDKRYNAAAVESLCRYLALMSIFYGFLCCSFTCSVAELCAVCIVKRRITGADLVVKSASGGFGTLNLYFCQT